jgi:hypothetical protein
VKADASTTSILIFAGCATALKIVAYTIAGLQVRRILDHLGLRPEKNLPRSERESACQWTTGVRDRDHELKALIGPKPIALGDRSLTGAEGGA